MLTGAYIMSMYTQYINIYTWLVFDMVAPNWTGMVLSSGYDM